MKGIGRGTIQRCDARPLTAPFLLMFHNYYHAINSNGTGGRPLRKRHSYALCVINTRVFLKTLSIVRNRPPPFSLSLCFFLSTRIEKGFLDLSPTVHFFPLPPSPFRTHFSLFTRDYAGFSLSFAPPEVVLDNPFSPPRIWIFPIEDFSSRFSPDCGRGKVKRGEDSFKRLPSKFFFSKKGISFRRFRARICSTFHTRIWKTYKHERIERAFAFFIDGTERGSRDFSNDDADLSPTDGPSIDFPCLYYSTDRLIRNRDIREKLIFTLTSSLSRSTREESWLFLLFFSAPNRFLLDCPFLFFIKNRKPLF